MDQPYLPTQLICEQRDFETTIKIIKVLVKHTAAVFQRLTKSKSYPKIKGLKKKFIDLLPDDFTRGDYLAITEYMGIPEKTAQGYITEFIKMKILENPTKGHYKKVQG